MSFNIKYYLIRHGETTANRDGVLQGSRDFPLTDLGKKQLLNCGIELNARNIDFDLCLVSDLKRAQHSAELLLSKLEIQPKLTVLDSNLREVSFGVREGFAKNVSIKDCKKRVAIQNGWVESRWTEIEDGIETEENVMNRQNQMRTCIQMIIDSYIKNNFKYDDTLADLQRNNISVLNQCELNAIDMKLVIDTINNKSNIHESVTDTSSAPATPSLKKNIHVLIVSHGGYILRKLKKIEEEAHLVESTVNANMNCTSTAPKSKLRKILNGSISIVNNIYEYNNGCTIIDEIESLTGKKNLELKFIKRYLNMDEVNVSHHSPQCTC